MRRKAIVGAFAIAVVALMVMSAIPTASGGTYEIGMDRLRLPPQNSGLFLPFMKHQYSYYGPGSSGLILYRNSILQSYGYNQAGDITRISFLNRWGGQVYVHPLAGPQFSPGVNSYLNFYLKMGATTRTSVTNTYSLHYDVAGPVTVFSRPGWFTVTGTMMNWMDFPLDTPFNFDGTSNLVIEYGWNDISGYHFGSNYGGTWTHGSYYRLQGNILSGHFGENGYSTMAWSALYYSATSGIFIYGPPNDFLWVMQIEAGSSALGLKEVALNILNGMPTMPYDWQNKNVDKGIQYLEQSLASHLWVDDNHLDPKKSKDVFTNEKKTAAEMASLIEDKKGVLSQSVKDDGQAVIDKLLEADILLAETIYDELLVYAGDPDADNAITKCQDDFDKGYEELAKLKYDSAIDHFGHVVAHAQQALNKVA
jgi:hypothetical protein